MQESKEASAQQEDAVSGAPPPPALTAARLDGAPLSGERLAELTPEQIYKLYQSYVKELSARLVELNQGGDTPAEATEQVRAARAWCALRAPPEPCNRLSIWGPKAGTLRPSDRPSVPTPQHPPRSRRSPRRCPTCWCISAWCAPWRRASSSPSAGSTSRPRCGARRGWQGLVLVGASSSAQARDQLQAKGRGKRPAARAHSHHPATPQAEAIGMWKSVVNSINLSANQRKEIVSWQQQFLAKVGGLGARVRARMGLAAMPRPAPGQ
jgi:hypothetical protein